jgi:hypothetical protein
MKHLSLLTLVILALACNPVKQVLKSESKTQQVIEAYIKTHPFKNDTILTVLPGDTITTEKIDTITQTIYKTIKDTVYATKTNTVTRVIEKRITDTVRESVNNYDFVNALNKQNENLKQEGIRKDEQNKILKEQVAEWKSTARSRNVKFFSLLAIVIGGAGLYAYNKFFKPTINVNTT